MRTHHLNFNNALAQWLASLPVANMNDSVENRQCQLWETVQSTQLNVLCCARRQHKDWFNDNDTVSSSLLAEKNQLNKAYVNHSTNTKKTTFYRSHCLMQQQLREVQDTWMAPRAQGFQLNTSRLHSPDKAATGTEKPVSSPHPPVRPPTHSTLPLVGMLGHRGIE
ncbi:unnamed protein product [Schistocephalus solidus]|uniref:DUF1311 domain-containing protein n=1 Tax=Schistocephalus solidus TaxID=70667 RepID=A0A183SSS7_SCHSO|nr:unnamed protein product [Schistocephalus solidus]